MGCKYSTSTKTGFTAYARTTDGLSFKTKGISTVYFRFIIIGKKA